MSQTIKLKRSSVTGRVPTTGNLDLGEIALNTNDGKVFFKKDDGTESVQTIVTTDSLTTGSIIVSGSTEVTGSSSVTGSFSLNGYSLPEIDGDDGQVIMTDGEGTLVFNDVVKYVTVKNIETVTLQKGTPVHATSSVGNTVEVVAASASLARTMPATFVLNESLDPDQEGRAILTGFINGVNTSAFNEGDVVYVGESSGYTNVKPTGTNLIQNLGIVTKIDVSNGSGYVYGSGRSNDVPNLLNGEVFFGEGNTSIQKPIGDILSGSSYVYSGSFSGSFQGDGSGLTGITAEGTVSQSGQVDHDQTLNFVSNEHIDHSGVSITAGSGLTGGGNITTSRTINVGAGDGITVNANDIQVDGTVLRTTGDSVVSSSSQIDHDQTTNFSSDEHFTQSNITTVGTVTVGDITGILPSGTVSASAQLTNTFLEITGDSVVSSSTQISHDSTSGFVSNEHINHTSVSISAGNGLTGGGTIASSRTINVGAGDGITVTADSVAVDTTVLRTTGDSVVSSSSQIDHDQTTNYSSDEHFTQGNITTLGTVTVGNVDAILPSGTFSGSITDELPSGVISSSAEGDGQGQIKLNGVNVNTNGLGTDDSPQFTNLTLSGNLTVNGTTTTVNSTEVEIGDRIIVLNGQDAAGDSGINVYDTSTNQTGSLLWDTTGDYWKGGELGSEVKFLRQTGDSIVSSSAQISHDSTSGFVSNEHIDHSSVSISSGNGLNGGGDLTSTRTLSVGQGDGITVGTGTVAVDSTVVRTSGDQTIGGNKTFSNNVLVNGNTTIGNASGDSFTVKTGTITLNQNSAASDTIISNTNAASDLVLKTSGGRVRVDDDLEVTSSFFVDFGGGGSSNYFEIKTNQLFAGTTFNLAGTTTSENVFNFTRDDTVLVTISGSGQLSVGQLPQDGYMLAVNGKSFFNDDVNINSGQLLIGGNTLGFQSNLDVDTGTEVVATISSSDFDGAFFDVIIKNGTNLRASHIMAVHDGTSVEFSETSTNDLGDTTDVTLSVDLSGGNIRLLATTTSDNWRVTTYVRGM